jgi:outer membrane receptor for ferrienterochelin and colicins
MYALKIVWIAFLSLIPLASFSNEVKGRVSNKEGEPLPGAYIAWKSRPDITTASAIDGTFSIPKEQDTDTLLVSMVGYAPLAIFVKQNQSNLNITLKEAALIEGVEVREQISAKSLDANSVRQVQRFSDKEFTKAACCNLSESFENISAVDVGTSDAVTGIRQIQMMGFSGIYIQTMVDNMPINSGLNSASGLTYIPGMYVKGMQLSKGVGSVTNGYDGMTGSLNIELRKPYNKERLIVNGYFNPMNLRTEGNVIFTHQLTNQWASTTMVHGSGTYAESDVNKDEIQDFPLQDNFQVSQKWMYMKDKWEAVFGGRYVNYKQRMDAKSPTMPQMPFWTSRHNDEKIEIQGMIGYVFNKEPIKSMGLRVNAIQNNLSNQFGSRLYNATENSMNAKWVYQNIVKNAFHHITIGASFYGNETREHFRDMDNDLRMNRQEYVPGVFAEWTETSFKNWVMVGGIRYDYHNFFGNIITPRLHTKWQMTEHTEVRLGAGRGQRTANPFADYQGIFSANRRVVLPNRIDNGFYGLQQEVSWNYGGSVSHCFKILHRPANITADYYYTRFDEQLQVDRDKDAGEIHFYNIKALGLNSFSHSASVELDFSPIKRSEIRTAYRYIDSRSDFMDGVQRFNPLISTHRAFINLAYELRNGWTFDFTVNWQSPKRLPQGENLPEDLKDLPTHSPSYTSMMAQVMKKFKKSFEIYAGGENLLNIRQDDLIRLASSPYSPYFDPTLVWGPSLGAMFYVGFRYYIY